MASKKKGAVRKRAVQSPAVSAGKRVGKRVSKASAAGGKSVPAAATKRAKKVASGTQPAAATMPAAPEAAAEGARTIVYVHGIGNKPPASVLKAQWDQALFEFDLGERSRLAYWVDRDRYPVAEAGVASGGDYGDDDGTAPTGSFSPRAMRESWDAAREMQLLDEDIDELLNVSGKASAESKTAQRMRDLASTLLSENHLVKDADFESLAEKHRGPDGAAARRIQAQRYGAAAVEAKVFGFLPRPMRQWMTRSVTRMFLRDVNDLFVDKAKSERMRNSLRERLRVGGGPFVIVAHSQGTMIAYCVLMEPEFAGLDVQLFVTMGSPLGIREVQDFIREMTKQTVLKVPPQVKRWVNVCDPLDPVALDKNLEGDYAPNAGKVKVDNAVTFNPDSPRHPHSATGYLGLAQVREPVRGAVDTGLFQPVAQFKMARDVVRAYADARSDERHRILVQLEDFATTSKNREDALARIYEVLGAGDPNSEQRQLLDPEPLQRYVALNLTREQAERLGAKADGDAKIPVARIWKNSAKWAYLDRSIHTTQAFPAHNSYHAEGADITWAVLDSGIHWSHPHFGENSRTIDAVYDCTDPLQRRHGLTPLDRADEDQRRKADDRYGHGAHVAGIIAGCHEVTDRDGKRRRMSGMAPLAKLVIYKVLDNNGSGEDSWIIKAIDHIYETNERAGRIVIHGVNLSLGGEFDVEAFNCGYTPLCVELRRL